ncbi:MAG TPA: hypothetical protein VIK33_15970 [Anaerolineae bacterium]
MPRLIRVTIAALIVAAMFAAPTYAARQMQDNIADITSPTDGQAVSGLVPIFGTATSNDFSRYEIAFGPDPNPTDAWATFAAADVVLTNAQIAVWDTTSLPPGTYALRLRVVRSDGNYAEDFVRGLIVGPAASPTPLATPTDVPPAPTFATEQVLPSIQPTVVIEQPPTATPEPTTVAGGAADGSLTSSRRGSSSGIDLSRFTSAFVDGATCAIGAFFLLGAMLLARWGMRRFLKQMRERSNQ